MGVNGVPVAPHGLILGENEATPSRKLFKHLPDLKTAININKSQETPESCVALLPPARSAGSESDKPDKP